MVYTTAFAVQKDAHLQETRKLILEVNSSNIPPGAKKGIIESIDKILEYRSAITRMPGGKLLVKPLEWSEELPPCDDCRYNHITATTPFGRFLITWKGWKEKGAEQVSIDESPWNEDITIPCSDVESAKQGAQKKYEEKLLSCFIFDKM